MALPFVKTFADCADFDKTVLAYLPQLYDLPQQIFQSATSWQQLQTLYVSTNPLISAFAFSLFLAPIFLIASEVNKNYSQVDRFWSLLPTLYNAHFVLYAHATGVPTRRLDTLLIVSGIWSARLTFNYWRKGGYSIGSEDYRWEHLKKAIGQPGFFLLNVTFISLIQSILLFVITSPTYILLLAARGTNENYQMADVVFSRGIALMVFIAFLADNQQWKYHEAKKVYQETAKPPPSFHRSDLDRGFNTISMWSYSRHPNFAAEQAVWILLYLWAAFITKGWLNWTIVGPISYVALFQGSTWYTELLSSKKYPDYKEYQKRVGRFLPWPSTGPPRDFSDKRGEEKKEK